ncbi:hypothetical protein RCL_jg19461.t1 [Rhizophagus clarus]|uniref:RNase H type-1 domain-containing protein n=1 Tax=Rhizophagus clarus TaxID=94130 RepID=A0A8H3QSS5_9GLOM|nr:hypothetical protein RCL_jg19461.t1 [Rhizophagus clarus]
MSSQYRNKPIQEQEIRKKNSLIKIWKPLQPQSQQPLWRRHTEVVKVHSFCKVELIKVKRHSNILGNEEADKLVAEGSSNAWKTIYDKLTKEFKIIGQKEMKDNKENSIRLDSAVNELLGSQTNTAQF